MLVFCLLVLHSSSIFKPLLPLFTLSLAPTQENKTLMHPLLLTNKTNLDAKNIEINLSMKLQFFSLFEVKNWEKVHAKKSKKKAEKDEETGQPTKELDVCKK